MNHSQLPEMSKRPRLIVRIGGMGNRVFGTDGSWKINENPAELQAAAKLACGEVLSQVELALSEIWRDEQLVHYPCDKHGPNRFITHWLSLVFGSRNRWNRNCPEFWHSVFQDVPPEVQVLTGHEIGSDQLIESVAAERSKHNEGQVAYSFKYIKPGSRDQTSDDGCELLSIGVAPEKPPVIKETIDSKQPISRQDAAQWSRVTRQRALAFRAQSDALRHHSDLLLAIWDPHAEAKPGGAAESVEIA